jgi:DNA-binding GntR family transcriptional regulator
MFDEKMNDFRLKAAVPIYVQIAESLMDQITSGKLSPDDRLPSERDMSQQLNVSRMTLRAALHELENKGLIVRRPGDGTYVARPKIERQASKLEPFTAGMRQRGYQTSAKVIIFEQRLAEVSTAQQLRLAVSSPVYYFQRLRLINQEPVMLEKCTFPASIFPGFEQFDLERRSVYEIFTSEYGIQAHHAEQGLEAVIATEFEAELLQVTPGAPMMLEHRLAFDIVGRPIEMGQDLYRGDRFRFVTEIAPLSMQ